MFQNGSKWKQFFATMKYMYIHFLKSTLYVGNILKIESETPS